MSYRSRRTGDIRSLLLACVGVPHRVARSRGRQFKECGIHKGAKCILKGRELTEKDLARVKESNDGNVVLAELPKTLFVEMLAPMKKQHDGLETNAF